MADIRPGRLAASLTFDDAVWREEVERFAAGSRPRVTGEAARRELERSLPGIGFKACAAEGSDGTRLPKCVKLFVPVGHSSSASAPFGFVFEAAVAGKSATLELRLLAFGERHPPPGVRTVYERAHKRLHGRYPDQ
jgi:hypothetical protein